MRKPSIGTPWVSASSGASASRLRASSTEAGSAARIASSCAQQQLWYPYAKADAVEFQPFAGDPLPRIASLSDHDESFRQQTEVDGKIFGGGDLALAGETFFEHPQPGVRVALSLPRPGPGRQQAERR